MGIAETNRDNASYLALTNEIDELVCQLYDITPKEIEVVKGSYITVVFVISTKEKSHNSNNYCDFSFVEMTKKVLQRV